MRGRKADLDSESDMLGSRCRRRAQKGGYTFSAFLIVQPRAREERGETGRLGWGERRHNMRRGGGAPSGRRPGPPRAYENAREELPEWMREQYAAEEEPRVPTHLTNSFKQKAKARFVATAVAADAARGLRRKVKKSKPSGFPLASGLTGRLVLSTSLNAPYHDEPVYSDLSIYEGRTLTLSGKEELIISQGEIHIELIDSRQRVMQSGRVTYGPLYVGPSSEHILISADKQLKVRVHSNQDGNFVLDELILAPPRPEDMPSTMSALKGSKMQTKSNTMTFDAPPGLPEEAILAKQDFTPRGSTPRGSRGTTPAADQQGVTLASRPLSRGNYQPRRKQVEALQPLDAAPRAVTAHEMSVHETLQDPKPTRELFDQLQLSDEDMLLLQQRPPPPSAPHPPPTTPATPPATPATGRATDASLQGLWVEALTERSLANSPQVYWYRIDEVSFLPTGETTWKRPPRVISASDIPLPQHEPAPSSTSVTQPQIPVRQLGLNPYAHRPPPVVRPQTAAAFELSAPFSKSILQSGSPPALSVSSVLALPEYAALVADGLHDAEANATNSLDAKYTHLARLLRSLLDRTPETALSLDDLHLLRSTGMAAVEGELFQQMVELVAASSASGHPIEALCQNFAPDSAMSQGGNMPLIGPSSTTRDCQNVTDGMASPSRASSYVMGALPQPALCSILQQSSTRAQTAAATVRAEQQGYFVLRSRPLAMSPRLLEPLPPELGLAAAIAARREEKYVNLQHA